MPNLERYEDIVPGVAKELVRTINGIPDSQTLVKAWLVCKEYYSDSDSDALFIKTINENDVPGQGQITDTGADTTGAVRFDLEPTDTIKLVAYIPAPYAIWVETSAGEYSRYIYEEGAFLPTPGVFSTIDFPQP